MEQLSERRKKDLLAKKRKYHHNPEKKKQTFNKRIHDESESIIQYRIEKYLMN